ncbi:MAG: hypothetical protein LBJ84_01590, partial [Oscillospiraceae bacterium]|nr:hypothetical protein [Oscillospiraceae bacterium]
AIYTGTDAADVRLLLDKYGARYIVIGKLERAKFGARLNEELLKALGDGVIYSFGDTSLIRLY